MTIQFSRYLTASLLICITPIGCTQEPTTLKPGVSLKVYHVVATKTASTISIVDEASGETLILQTPPIFTENDVEVASVMDDGETGPRLQMELTVAGGQQLQAATSTTGGRIAIVLNHKCLSAPTVRTTISGSFQVTGDFSASGLADMLQPAE